jgi:hypothetical protein
MAEMHNSVLEDVEANAENEPQNMMKKGCTIEEVRGQYILASSRKQLLQNVIIGFFPSSTYRVHTVDWR